MPLRILIDHLEKNLPDHTEIRIESNDVKIVCSWQADKNEDTDKQLALTIYGLLNNDEFKKQGFLIEQDDVQMEIDENNRCFLTITPHFHFDEMDILAYSLFKLIPPKQRECEVDYNKAMRSIRFLWNRGLLSSLSRTKCMKFLDRIGDRSFSADTLNAKLVLNVALDLLLKDSKFIETYENELENFHLIMSKQRMIVINILKIFLHMDLKDIPANPVVQFLEDKEHYFLVFRDNHSEREYIMPECFVPFDFSKSIEGMPIAKGSDLEKLCKIIPSSMYKYLKKSKCTTGAITGETPTLVFEFDNSDPNAIIFFTLITKLLPLESYVFSEDDLIGYSTLRIFLNESLISRISQRGWKGLVSDFKLNSNSILLLGSVLEHTLSMLPLDVFPKLLVISKVDLTEHPEEIWFVIRDKSRIAKLTSFADSAEKDTTTEATSYPVTTRENILDLVLKARNVARFDDEKPVPKPEEKGMCSVM